MSLRLFKLCSTALSIVTLMILCPFAVLAQAVPGLAPLELIVSFLPQILLVSTISVATLAVQNIRLALLALPILFFTALPFLTLSKFERGSGHVCEAGECLTVITANIYGIHAAMPKLNALAERESADLIAINEAGSGLLAKDYEPVFPAYPHVLHAAWENMPKHMGNPITVLSRLPFENAERVLRTDTGRRAYLVADLQAPWADARIVALHARTPLTQRTLNARNAILEAVENRLAPQDTFILLGDFNLTAWSPTFRKLPGQRAGDPRLSNTWPTFAPILGLSIDHVMFDGDLELVEFKVLESVGSDHYPILARFRRPD
ncbi:MAG: endonuclease/exonuclease/phosphatase family protein [Pseudomonadota bacterium]